jgi:phosphoglycerate-specific signal transduction histidine kinase
MEINISNAVDLFFPNPSLETVYFEAIANALDANASEISISISIESFSNPNTLEIQIRDNGDGFTDRNFGKFSRVLESEEKTHKGIGRLVFLDAPDKSQLPSSINVTT